MSGFIRFSVESFSYQMNGEHVRGFTHSFHDALIQRVYDLPGVRSRLNNAHVRGTTTNSLLFEETSIRSLLIFSLVIKPSMSLYQVCPRGLWLIW